MKTDDGSNCVKKCVTELSGQRIIKETPVGPSNENVGGLRGKRIPERITKIVKKLESGRKKDRARLLKKPYLEERK